MITYAEKEGKNPFNWNTFLNKKNYSTVELKKAWELSNNWITCACGNQCSIIDRNGFSEPTDSKLYRLGCKFTDNINCMFQSHMITMDDEDKKMFDKSKQDAKNILKKIEERSTELIKLKVKEFKKSLPKNIVI